MFKKMCATFPLLVVAVSMTACSNNRQQVQQSKAVKIPKAAVALQKKVENVPVVYEKRSPRKHAPKRATRIAKSNYANSFNHRLSNAALGRLRSKVRYDGAYVKIAYPGGDVSPNTGVCTDVVIRSYRKLGIDLQEQVHRDMSAAFHTYPNPSKWGLSRPDTNIDHRRVYNLRKFFQRRGAALPITRNPRNYKPGDLVTWMVGPDLPHIGVVVNKRSKADPNRLMIVHNIAHGVQMEDILFAFPITGHYRYTPAHMGNIPNGILTQNSRSSKRRGMSYNELMQAAKILGKNTNSVTKASTTQPKRQTSNQNLLDQVVRLNSLKGGPVVKPKNSSLTLANMTNAEIESLLIK